MDSLIRETNDNLKVIIDTLKNNLDNSISTLDNIQIQMDKKVEEAKKYKIQVDSAKERINNLETDNKALELSLKELNDKYGKMNLISLIEAGNKEIKTKINDNNREINKEKEQIADLTNKARMIKDLLMNLKKDKTVKEERLEHIKTIYKYYNDRINDIMDYAFNHAENLDDYKVNYVEDYDLEVENVNRSELENTMVFDEIANIDGNNIFKDEMTFISDEIVNSFDNIEKNDKSEYSDLENNEELNENLDSTQVFDSIFDETISDSNITNDNNDIIINNSDLFINDETELENDEELSILKEETSKFVLDENFDNVQEELEISEEKEDEFKPFVIEAEADVDEVSNNDNTEEKDIEENEFKTIGNLDIFNIGDDENNENELNEADESEERISKINDLFNSIDNTKTSNIPLTNVEEDKVNRLEKEIDNAYIDIFGKSLDENDLNKTTTLTDIFGNPIKKEEVAEESKVEKDIIELFVENGVDFNKFKEDEQSYLKQIYNEEKFSKIFDVLNKNKINLANLYKSFNIFGEISSEELENLITKLINSGQSIEAIGLVLEKLPKVNKYNLDDAISSFGEYIKDIDITELIMKAKDLYDGGNN